MTQTLQQVTLCVLQLFLQSTENFKAQKKQQEQQQIKQPQKTLLRPRLPRETRVLIASFHPQTPVRVTAIDAKDQYK